MRKQVVAVLLALIVAACGGDGDAAVDSPAPTTHPDTAETAPTTGAPTSEAAEDPSDDGTSQEQPQPSGPSFDGPAAPDFELLLADGSTFRLSDEAKPVYMVFWAEW